ncbi:MAG: LysR family transcriptional regulator [Solirubrobacteraceae bacterium]
MELRQLATFVAVAEEGSFTRAADRLHVVQSAVSAAVRNLEKELGAPLFDRSTHSVKLTDAGRALLPDARATLAAAHAAKDAVDQALGGLRGTVVLGTMQAQGMRAIDLAGVLATFRSEHPAVEVQIRHVGGSQEMARDVLQGRLDLAFVALPGSGPPGVALTPLASEPIMLAVPAGHPLAKRTGIEIQALQDETLVDLPAGWGIRMAVDRALAAAGVTRTIAYEVNDTATMIEFIRNGLAIGMLPRSLVETTTELAFVPIRDHPPQFHTAIAAPANRQLSAATRAMLETIKRYSSA